MKWIAILSLTSLVSAIFGMIIGAGALAYFTYEDKDASEVLQLHNNIGMHVGILNEIHRGDIEKAKELHEIFLDSEIIGLTTYVSSDSPVYKEALEAAWIAANYRKQHNHNITDQSVSGHVQSILDKGLMSRDPCEPPNKALNNDAQNARAC